MVLHLSLTLKVPATWFGDLLVCPRESTKTTVRGLQLCPGLGPFCKSGSAHPSWNGRTAIPAHRLQPSCFLWPRMDHLLPTCPYRSSDSGMAVPSACVPGPLEMAPPQRWGLALGAP